jgi:hypothetical protein
MSRLQGHTAAGSIRSIEKSNELIGNRTRDIPACSMVPQPTTLPHAPFFSTASVRSIFSFLSLYDSLITSTSYMTDVNSFLIFAFCLHFFIIGCHKSFSKSSHFSSAFWQNVLLTQVSSILISCHNP